MISWRDPRRPWRPSPRERLIARLPQPVAFALDVVIQGAVFALTIAGTFAWLLILYALIAPAPR